MGETNLRRGTTVTAHFRHIKQGEMVVKALINVFVRARRYQTLKPVSSLSSSCPDLSLMFPSQVLKLGIGLHGAGGSLNEFRTPPP